MFGLYRRIGDWYATRVNRMFTPCAAKSKHVPSTDLDVAAPNSWNVLLVMLWKHCGSLRLFSWISFASRPLSTFTARPSLWYFFLISISNWLLFLLGILCFPKTHLLRHHGLLLERAHGIGWIHPNFGVFSIEEDPYRLVPSWSMHGTLWIPCNLPQSKHAHLAFQLVLPPI